VYFVVYFSWHRFVFFFFNDTATTEIYTSVIELNARFGDGLIFKIFFTKRSSELKPMPNASGASLPPVGRLSETHKSLK
jgi:hypothetical protein